MNNEWVFGTSTTTGPNGCPLANQLYAIDKASPVTYPSAVSLLPAPATTYYQIQLTVANPNAIGLYQFYIKTQLNDATGPNSFIWSDLINVRVGDICAFHMTPNANYPPYIENIAELSDPNFDESVWCYVDYS